MQRTSKGKTEDEDIQCARNLDSCLTPIFTYDPARSIFYSNSAGDSWLAIYGLNDGIRDLMEFFRPMNPGDDLKTTALNVIATRQSRVLRHIFISSASEQYVDFYFYPYIFEDQSLVCIQPIGTGLLRIQADENRQNLNLLVEERTAELNELNSFLSAIVDSSTETCIIAIGTNGTILSFNEGACLLFGYARNEVVGRMNIAQLFSLEERNIDAWNSMVLDATNTGKARRLTYLERKESEIFPALVDLTPLRNAERQSMGMLFVGRDVTETIRTQRELEEKKEQLEFLNRLSLEISQTLKLEEIASITLQHLVQEFDGIAGALYLRNQVDHDLKQIAISPDSCNDDIARLVIPSIEDYILVEEGEMLLRDLNNECAQFDFNSESQHITKMLLPLLPKASFIGIIVIISRKGGHRTEEFLSFLSAITATVGGAIENAILYHDSLSKSIEIKKQNQELDEFAYVVSHDLKEPLAGISFISNLIIDDYYDRFDEVGKTYIASLIDFSKRLGSLIDALLDLSRIGRITQPPERVDITDVLRNVQQNLSYRIASKNIRLTLPDFSPIVFGDRTRIEQVFFNLLSNAIKFNDKPEIQVEIGHKEEHEDFITFMIKDNGIGIEPEYFEKIFNIFERLHPREEYEGTGAGLTIIKKIIEHHGGKIWLESVLNEGTTFFFTLPKCNANQ